MEGIPKGNIDLIWRPRDIYDDFLLNDIKTKQDSMRQLFAVNALLTGAYITVLSGIAIKLFDGSLSKLNLGDGYWGGISGLIVILLLSAPVFSWFYSSARCWGFGTGVESDLVINLKDKAGVSVLTEAEYKSIKYNSGLIQYNRELHLTLSFASLLTNVGLFCVVVYCILAITLFVANLAN